MNAYFLNIVYSILDIKIRCNFACISEFATFMCEQLLATADSSTSDVSGLHAKLDRKRNVDSHNASVQEKFHVRFHEGIDDLSGRVKDFIAQQQQFSASLCNSFGQSLGHL